MSDSNHPCNVCTKRFFIPSISIFFGCIDGEDIVLVTLKLAGSVSADPTDIPRTSLGLNFFLQEGARLKFLSSSWRETDINARVNVLQNEVKSVQKHFYNYNRKGYIQITSSSLRSVPRTKRLLYSLSRRALAWKIEEQNERLIFRLFTLSYAIIFELYTALQSFAFLDFLPHPSSRVR